MIGFLILFLHVQASPFKTQARLNARLAPIAEIAEHKAQALADLPDVHPNAANIYRGMVATFTEVLDDPDGGATAAEAIRSLIGDVVLRPGRKRGRSRPSCAVS